MVMTFKKVFYITALQRGPHNLNLVLKVTKNIINSHG